MARSDDIVGYAYRADLYCPRDIASQVRQSQDRPRINAGTGLGQRDPESWLDRVAAQWHIDRQDESTFDSGDFPKVVFRDGLGHTFTEMPGHPRTCWACGGPKRDHSPDRCASCGEVLGE